MNATLVSFVVLCMLALSACGPVPDRSTLTQQPVTITKPSQTVSPNPESNRSPASSNIPTADLAGNPTATATITGTRASASPTNPPETATHLPTTPQSTPDTLLVPTHYLHITFVDRLHGWIAGRADWQDSHVDAMASTSDGGKTWGAIRVPPIDQNFLFTDLYFYPPYHIRLLFTDAKSGWLYQGTLFHTNDGGQTWRQEHPQGKIIQMGKAPDGTSWALEQVGNDWTLLKVSGDSYDTWTKLGYQFPVDMSGMTLAIVDDQHAWIDKWVNFQTSDPEAGSHLYRTRDGGKNWEKVTPPEPCDFFPLIISPVDTQNIWLGCGLAAGAGSGLSDVFVSHDGGDSWHERKHSELGYFSGISSVSTSFVYMTFMRAPSVTITKDGGKTWFESPIDCLYEDPKAFFIDDSFGWAACDSTINRTVDGGKTWEMINLQNK